MKHLLIYTLIIVASLVAACTSGESPDEQSRHEAETRLVVAVTPTLDCLPLYVAEATAIADTLGRHLILQQHTARADCDSSLIGGSVSAIMTDYGRAANLRAAWHTKDTLTLLPHDNLTLFLFTNYKARLKEASQLTDKMIAIDRKSGEADMVGYVLDSVKLSEKTYLVNIPSLAIRRQMIMSNIMDAVVLAEPQATAVRRAGHKQIYAAAMIGGKRAGCLVARRDAALIRRLYNHACDTINRVGIHRYDSIIVKRMGVTPDIARAIKRITFKKI